MKCDRGLIAALRVRLSASFRGKGPRAWLETTTKGFTFESLTWMSTY